MFRLKTIIIFYSKKSLRINNWLFKTIFKIFLNVHIYLVINIEDSDINFTIFAEELGFSTQYYIFFPKYTNLKFEILSWGK